MDGGLTADPPLFASAQKATQLGLGAHTGPGLSLCALAIPLTLNSRMFANGALRSEQDLATPLSFAVIILMLLITVLFCTSDVEGRNRENKQQNHLY